MIQTISKSFYGNATAGYARGLLQMIGKKTLQTFVWKGVAGCCVQTGYEHRLFLADKTTARVPQR